MFKDPLADKIVSVLSEDASAANWQKNKEAQEAQVAKGKSAVSDFNDDEVEALVNAICDRVGEKLRNSAEGPTEKQTSNFNKVSADKKGIASLKESEDLIETVAEEVLNELSKKTLNRYINKAHRHVADIERREKDLSQDRRELMNRFHAPESIRGSEATDALYNAKRKMSAQIDKHEDEARELKWKRRKGIEAANKRFEHNRYNVDVKDPKTGQVDKHKSIWADNQRDAEEDAKSRSLYSRSKSRKKFERLPDRNTLNTSSKKLNTESVDYDDLAESIYEEVLSELSRKTLVNYSRKAHRDMNRLQTARDSIRDADDANYRTRDKTRDILNAAYRVSKKANDQKELSDAYDDSEKSFSSKFNALKKAGDLLGRKIRRREDGIDRAEQRLQKEDVEYLAAQITEEVLNELSNTKLLNYIDASKKQVSSLRKAAGDNPSSSGDARKIEKRVKGGWKATGKLVDRVAAKFNEDINVDAIYEEVLNELSKGTLNSYIKKAADNKRSIGNRIDSLDRNRDEADDYYSTRGGRSVAADRSATARNEYDDSVRDSQEDLFKKIRNRNRGIVKASNKLTNEDIESLASDITEDIITEMLEDLE